MCESERPREKAIKHGIDKLSNRDLLAIIIRSGIPNKSVLQLADELLTKERNLSRLQCISYEQLIKIKGIKQAKAIELLACFELSKRISKDEIFDEVIIDQPKTLVQWLNKEIGFLRQEHFLAVFLDTKNKIINEKTIFIGSLDRTVVHPREIYKEAIRLNASKIMVVHNHPSGDCTPSQSDILTTQRIRDVGVVVGIPLMDHIIVGNNNYFSLRENKLLD